MTRSDSGFAMAALIFFLTATAILIAATVPSYQMQANRGQEEELIFRGEEYMRAIAKYQRKVGIYPPSVDALLETNGIRFLRKAYADPIAGKPFRLIFINPDGSVSGSTLYNNTASPNPFGQQGSVPQNQQNLQNAQGAQAQQFAQAQGQRQGQSQQPGQQQVTGRPSQSQQPGQRQGQQAQQQGQRQGQPGQPMAGQQGFGNAASGTSGIIGVGSESELESVKVYNGKQHYNEWEFIAILNQPNGQQQQQQRGQQNPQQPNLPGQTPNQPNFGINGVQPGFGQPNMPQPGFGQPRPNPNPIPNQPFGFGTPQPQQPIKRPD